MEAVIASAYLSSGLEATEDMVLRLFEPLIDRAADLGRVSVEDEPSGADEATGAGGTGLSGDRRGGRIMRSISAEVPHRRQGPRRGRRQLEEVGGTARRGSRLAGA